MTGRPVIPAACLATLMAEPPPMARKPSEPCEADTSRATSASRSAPGPLPIRMMGPAAGSEMLRASLAPRRHSAGVQTTVTALRPSRWISSCTPFTAPLPNTMRTVSPLSTKFPTTPDGSSTWAGPSSIGPAPVVAHARGVDIGPPLSPLRQGQATVKWPVVLQISSVAGKLLSNIGWACHLFGKQIEAVLRARPTKDVALPCPHRRWHR